MTNDESQVQTGVTASRGRLVLALFIDFCFLGAFLGFIHGLIPQATSIILNKTTGIGIILLLLFILEWFFLRILKKETVGQYALSTFVNPKGGIQISDPDFFLVDKNIKEREHWLTLFFGVYLINDGCKQVYRWVLGHSFPPLFGIDIPSPLSIVCLVVAGILSIQIGFGILRLGQWAFYAALGYFFFLTFGFLLGHEQIALWFQREILVLEQTGHGKKISPQEIKSYARILVTAIEYSGVIFAGLLYINKNRFK